MVNQTQNKRPQRKKNVGIVISDRMDKTIVVRVESLTKNPVYNRIVKSHSKFKVHDQQNQAKIGDKVSIVETRPLSKDKRWRLIEIVKKR